MSITVEEIEKIVTALVAQECGLAKDSVARESTVEGLGLDSLESMELQVAVSEEFDIVIPDQKWLSLKTVGDIVDYVASRQE